MRLIPILITFIFVNVCCSPKQKPQKFCIDQKIQPNCEKVLFDSLISNPDEFEDKCIELEGYLVLRFEEVGIFKSKDKTFSGGAVWLKMENNVSQQVLKNFPKGIPGKISVTGVFNHSNDRFGYFGELDQKGCVEIKED